MKKKPLKKLNIDLFGSYNGKTLQDMYNTRRLEFIAGSERYIKGYSTGLFGYRDGYYEKTPQVGEAEWNKKYPKGIEDFKENFMTLNSVGQQSIINKINEIIKYINQ
jgi:hypothetical protein